MYYLVGDIAHLSCIIGSPGGGCQRGCLSTSRIYRYRCMTPQRWWWPWPIGGKVRCGSFARETIINSQLLRLSGNRRRSLFTIYLPPSFIGDETSPLLFRNYHRGGHHRHIIIYSTIGVVSTHLSISTELHHRTSSSCFRLVLSSTAHYHTAEATDIVRRQ